MSAATSRPARILVLYHSTSGNTKLMAELVAEGATGVPETELRLLSVSEAGAADLLWCDGVAVGSPTCMGTIAWQMKRWWDETAQPLWPKIEGKLGCAFSSSGGLAGGGELTCLALLVVLMPRAARPTHAFPRPVARSPPGPIRCGYNRRAHVGGGRT
jgi:NAD(P)H dehydrogenase (quinone)